MHSKESASSTPELSGLSNFTEETNMNYHVTIPQLAERLGITSAGIQNWIRRGLIGEPPILPDTGKRGYSLVAADRIEHWHLKRSLDPRTRSRGAGWEARRAATAARIKELAEAESFRQRDKHKKAAQAKLQVAVARGDIVKPSECSQCGASRRLDGHHTDYDKPLEVVWLCRSCRGAKHGKAAALATTEADSGEADSEA